MTSSKCKQCGLVNPIHVSVCKRCGFPLADGEIPNRPPETDKKTMPAENEQSGMRIIETSAPAVFAVSAEQMTTLRFGVSKEPTRLTGSGFFCHLGFCRRESLGLLFR